MIEEISCVLGPCLESFTKDPVGLGLSGLFVGVAFLSSFMILKNKSPRARLRWSYPLVFSFLFLLTYFSFTMACHSNLPFCVERAAMYAVPAGVIGSILFGYIILPFAYLAWQRGKLSPELSSLLPVQGIPVYISDRGTPFAFSYGGIRRWIVVSQGMIDILSKRELEAVLLHEYAHISSNTSLYQITGFIYSRLPLLHAFLDGRKLEDTEEEKADSFAIRTQNTSRYLNSAKKKLEGYFCS